MTVIAIADIFGISGRRGELTALFSRTEQHVRSLPGSRRYAFAARIEAPDEFVLVGEWDSEAAMDAYYRSEALRVGDGQPPVGSTVSLRTAT